MLRELNLDLEKIHFVGVLTFDEYIKLLQVSSAHIYSSVPFVLSWSILDAMATGCCLIASNTAPVKEVIEDGHNGLLFDFYDVDMLVSKIEYALNNKEEMKIIRNNARTTVLENYDLRILLPKQIELLNTLITRYKEKMQ
jgi:glycosyltransferase involved in cell wall biosynthesis